MRRALRPSLLALVVLGAASASACGAPALSQDGQLVFTPPGGKRGASVMTANGVQFMDTTDLPHAVEQRSANDPWQAPTGFLLPRDGVWRETSTPVPIQGHGLAVVLRSSDMLVPSWGGEILLRVDTVTPALAFPAAAASVRAPEYVAVVLDSHDANTGPLATIALDDLGERDKVVLIEAAASGGSDLARTVVPLVPGTNRTLVGAAIERLASAPATPARDLAGALEMARVWLTKTAPAGVVRQVLVLSDGRGAGGENVGREAAALAREGLRLAAIGTPDDVSADALAALGNDVTAGLPFDAREDAVERAVPPPGDIVLSDVTLAISSVPAPSRLLELSGGAAALALDHDRFALGDLYAGEARTEIARIAIPQWTPGESLELKVTATYVDKATGAPLSADATVHCRYTDDVEAIANSRHGDVIAYASGLAMVRRLRRAFAGSEVDRIGGLRPVVTWQAQSLGTLAKTTGDAALGEEAEILTALLGAIPD